MSHLGERVTSLVDGQLSIESSERALMHVAGCTECREAVETERLTKRRLAALGAPQAGDRLIGMLLELAGPSGPLPPRPGHVPGSPRPELVASLAGIAGREAGSDVPPTSYLSGSTGPVAPGGPGAFEPFRTLTTRPPGRRGTSRPPLVRTAALGRVVGRSSRNRVAAAMVGAACLVGAGVAGGVANGQVTGNRVVPPVDSYVLEHSMVTGTLPLGGQTVMWGAVGAGR